MKLSANKYLTFLFDTYFPVAVIGSSFFAIVELFTSEIVHSIRRCKCTFQTKCWKSTEWTINSISMTYRLFNWPIISLSPTPPRKFVLQFLLFESVHWPDVGVIVDACLLFVFLWSLKFLILSNSICARFWTCKKQHSCIFCLWIFFRNVCIIQTKLRFAPFHWLRSIVYSSFRHFPSLIWHFCL